MVALEVLYDLVRFLSPLLPGGLLAERSFVFGGRGPHPSTVQHAPAIPWRGSRRGWSLSRRAEGRHAHFLVQRFVGDGFPGVVRWNGLFAHAAFAPARGRQLFARHGSRPCGWMEGSLGTISMPIRENGTGEIIFSMAGVRRCSGARSDDGKAIEKGAEVVIERYEKGIAYVKRWEEFTK